MFFVGGPALFATAEPPGIFARATADEPLERLTFLMPGVSYVAWQPVRIQSLREPSSGAGLELSLARWMTGGFYVGGVLHAQRLDRSRAAFGVEVGYQLFGLELGIAREFSKPDGPAAQWSLQIAPYASLGMVYVAPVWIVAIDRRSRMDTPGDGAMLVVGLKLPIKVSGS